MVFLRSKCSEAWILVFWFLVTFYDSYQSTSLSQNTMDIPINIGRFNPLNWKEHGIENNEMMLDGEKGGFKTNFC